MICPQCSLFLWRKLTEVKLVSYVFHKHALTSIESGISNNGHTSFLSVKTEKEPEVSPKDTFVARATDRTCIRIKN